MAPLDAIFSAVEKLVEYLGKAASEAQAGARNPLAPAKRQ
jgi:hypothetical protein